MGEPQVRGGLISPKIERREPTNAPVPKGMRKYNASAERRL